MNYPPNSFMPPQMGQMQPQMGQMPMQQQPQQPTGQFPPNMMGDQHPMGQFPPLGGQMPQTPPILQQQQPMLGQNMVPQHQDGFGRQWAMDHMQQFMGQHQMGWPQALGMLGGYGLRSLLHRGQ